MSNKIRPEQPEKKGKMMVTGKRAAVVARNGGKLEEKEREIGRDQKLFLANYSE